MKKRVIYVAFWNTELEDLINYLKQQQYENTEQIEHLEFMLKESDNALA